MGDGGKENGDGDKSGVGQSVNGDGSGGDVLSTVDYVAKTHELQTIIEKQTAELSQWQRRVSDLNNKISEMEENLSKVQKEYAKAQDQCAKLQRDLRENVAQKEDQVRYYYSHFIPI